MTSEQRNEIAMEVLDEVLTEATRYAKETRKKTEQGRSDIRRYNERIAQIKSKIWQCSELNKPDEKKKWEKKLDEIKDKRKDARIKVSESLKTDSISHRNIFSDISNEDAARKQPGRYSYRLPRKDVHNTPGFWKD